MEIRYKQENSSGEVVFCNLNANEILEISNVNSLSQKIVNGKLRAGRISTATGITIGFTSDKDLLNSSQLFKKALDCIHNSLNQIEKIREEITKEINKNTSRLIHNLTSLNGHNIQEIYSLISQENISTTKDTHVRYVESIIKEDPREAAITLLRIAKNNAAMKTEFSVFKKLFTTNPSLSKKNHNTHKVLMNIFYLFFPDFTDKEVRVTVGDATVHTAYFDYESIHVALYHLIENTTKYIKPKTQLKVIIEDLNNYVAIKMDMISLEIKEKERLSIFEEGSSGEHAIKLGNAGDGIGLSRVKRIIELNSGSVEAIPFPETLELHHNIPYQRNVFQIKLPKR